MELSTIQSQLRKRVLKKGQEWESNFTRWVIFIKCVSDRRTTRIRPFLRNTSIRGHISIHLDSHYRALSGRLKYLPSETFTSWPILMIALDTRVCRHVRVFW